MELNTFSEELLLSLVKEYECIWNRKSSQFRNYNLRQNAWWEISEHFIEPEVSAKFCKDKYKRLLDARNAARKNQILYPDRHKKVYKYEHLMGFLEEEDPEEEDVQNLLESQVTYKSESNEDEHTHNVDIQNLLSGGEEVEESPTDWVPEEFNHEPPIVNVKQALRQGSKPVFLSSKKTAQQKPRRIAPKHNFVVLGQNRVYRNPNVPKLHIQNGLDNQNIGVKRTNVLVATPSAQSNITALSLDAHSHFGNTIAAIMRTLPASKTSQLRIKILQLLDEAQNNL